MATKETVKGFAEKQRLPVRSVRLKSVLGWQDEMIAFGAGVNVIVGESDAGKSNIVRAIAAVVQNCPADDLVTTGSKTGGEVALFTVGNTIVLDKRNGKNGYTLHARGVDKATEFSKVGAGVPAPVLEAMNLGPHTIGDREVSLNIQQQRDPVLVVDDTPSQAAKIIGSISGLDAVHRAATKAAKLVRDADGKLRSADAEIATARDALRSHKTKHDLESLAAKLTAAQDARDLADRTRRDADAVRSLIDRAELTNTAIRRAHATSNRVAGALERAELFMADSLNESNAIERLGRLIESARRRSIAIKQDRNLRLGIERDIIALTNRLHLALKDAGVCPTCGQEIKE